MAIRPVDPSIGVDVARDAHAAVSNARQQQQQRSVAPVAHPEVVAANGGGDVEQHAVPPPPAPNLRVQVDQDTGKTVISIVDPETGQVLRQMPSAEALEVAKAIGKFQGMFVDLKV
jgi:flagellar protein FlaG